MLHEIDAINPLSTRNISTLKNMERVLYDLARETRKSHTNTRKSPENYVETCMKIIFDKMVEMKRLAAASLRLIK